MIWSVETSTPRGPNQVWVADHVHRPDRHPVFFTVAHSPWQRGTNENTNGLLRQHFPKGTDLSQWDHAHLEAVAAELNSRPRKTLGWRTPTEAFDDHLRSLQQPGVASTD